MRLAPATLLFLSVVCAQTDRGTITGRITDTSGAAIGSAKVAVVSITTNTTINAVASDSGEFTAPNLLVGVYRVEVTQSGFKKAVENGISVSAGDTLRVDVQLQVGQVSETIEVTAQGSQIQTESSQVRTAVSNKMVDELPLVVGGAMRSVFNLVTITPESKGSGTQLALGGGQAASWNATLDGLSITTNRSADAVEISYLTPSVDAITEFAVDTNGFKAEYGQAGGGVMSFVSKSGTNQFHGALYNFLRNDAMDSRGFFARVRSVYRQNNFGATAGGPVLIPKIYNGRNKTFFFAAYEGFRNRVGANDQILSVPTPEMYNGDFRNWVDNSNRLLPIYDPSTTRTVGGAQVRDLFPNNQVPASRFSGIARQMMAIARPIAVPNRANLTPGNSNYVRLNYLVSAGALESPTDKGSIRVDHNINTNHRLSFFYNQTRFDRVPGAGGPPGLAAPLWNGQVEEFPTKAYRGSYDWVVTPNILNLFSFGINSFDKLALSPNVGGNWKDKVCLKNVIDCNDNLMNVAFSEFQQWGGTSVNGTYQPSWQIKNDFSWIRGKHTIKAGYLFHHQSAEGFGQQDISGRAEFSFLGTSVPGATAFTSGSSFASFLLGEANVGRTETIRFVPQVYPYHGWYAQTDWRIARNFVLNLGVRYDLTLPPRSKSDEYSDLNPTRPNPGADGFPGALWFAGFGPGRENTRSLVPGWYGGVGPRLSLAWSPDSKTSIRAGYGRTYSRLTVVSGSGHFAGFIGQYRFASLDQGVTPAFRLDEGLPQYLLPPQINPAFQNGLDVDYWQGQEATRAPIQDAWTFSIQRQMAKNTVVEIAYNGTAGARLQTGLLVFNQVPTNIYNDLVGRLGGTAANALLRADIRSASAVAAGIRLPYPSFRGSVAQGLRPFPQYQNVVTAGQNGDKSGHSNYHALILKADRRLSGGLTFQWNYVFSKIITDSDTYYANMAGAQDHYNRSLESSIGAFDQTHNLKMSTIYELPFGKGRRWLQSGPANWVLGGWRVAAVQVYASGRPVGLSRNNPLPIFNAQTRPVINGYDNWRPAIKGDKFDPAVDRFLDLSMFPAQPVSLMGNATRFNPKLRGFAGLNEDVSIGKSFPLWGEGRRVDFRAEAFNIFNRTVFAVPSANLNSNTFGVVTAQANSPRQMQLALKIYW